MPDELRIQELLTDWLSERGLYPFDVFYTKTLGGLLKISFILKPEVTEFLELIEYDSLADKSGVLVMEDGYTCILRGIALGFFFRKFSG